MTLFWYLVSVSVQKEESKKLESDITLLKELEWNIDCISWVFELVHV